MKTILRSRDLWDLVQDGIDETEKDQGQIKNAQKRDARVMAIIQLAIHDQLFSCVAAASTTKETWDILKLEFQGGSQVKVVKLQGLRRDYENLLMKEGEVLGDYFGRVMALVSQMRAFCLTSKFDYVVPSIEINHDLATLTPVKLMGCLQSQEERINSRTPKKTNDGDAQALQVMQESNKNKGNLSRGRGRLSFRGRGHGRSQNSLNSMIPYCICCNKYCHEKKGCWYNEETAATASADNENALEDDERLFMAFTNEEPFGNETTLWFLGSRASNRMTGAKECFTYLDENFKIEVKLGDKKELQVQGKGTMKIVTPNGNTRLLDDVYFVPQQGYNLLSVG
ncbi:uncharacterized protein LOC143566275 [Bidens hawaiensis]|uniref:uncharacterized protein LOC143566275 n=1 Tax=Bidens hawaiensis TaxID=980011 RepID=UPI00404B211D